jgi:hypothetical protein
MEGQLSNGSESDFIFDVQAKTCLDVNELSSLYENIHNIKIVHINIRSVNKHFDEFVIMLNESNIAFDNNLLQNS